MWTWKSLHQHRDKARLLSSEKLQFLEEQDKVDLFFLQTSDLVIHVYKETLTKDYQNSKIVKQATKIIENLKNDLYTG